MKRILLILLLVFAAAIPAQACARCGQGGGFAGFFFVSGGGQFYRPCPPRRIYRPRPVVVVLYRCYVRWCRGHRYRWQRCY